MFINSKKHFVFTSTDGDLLDIPRDYIGDLPDWVTKTKLFKMAVDDKVITMVGESQKTGKGINRAIEIPENPKKNK